MPLARVPLNSPASTVETSILFNESSKIEFEFPPNTDIVGTT